MLIDLHVPASLDPAATLARAAACGLDGIGVLSKSGPAGWEPWKGVAAGGVKLFFGLELVCDHGHFLCFFPEGTALDVPERWFGAEPRRGWSAREVLEKVAEKGGVAIPAHPYDRDVERFSGDYLFTVRDRLCAFQGLHGGKSPGTNDLAVDAAEHLGLPLIGGSGAERVEQVGRAATLFAREFAGETQLVAALRGGSFFPVGLGTPPPLGDLARAHRHERERAERSDRDDRGPRRHDDRGGGGRGGGRGGRPRRRR